MARLGVPGRPSPHSEISGLCRRIHWPDEACEPQAHAVRVNCAAVCARRTPKKSCQRLLCPVAPVSALQPATALAPGDTSAPWVPWVDAPSRETLKRAQPGLEYNPEHGLTSEDFSRPPQPSPTSLRLEVGTHRGRLYLHIGWVPCAEIDHDASQPASQPSNLPPARAHGLELATVTEARTRARHTSLGV